MNMKENRRLFTMGEQHSYDPSLVDQPVQENFYTLNPTFKEGPDDKENDPYFLDDDFVPSSD
jgi:hypothetical protein